MPAHLAGEVLPELGDLIQAGVGPSFLSATNERLRPNMVPLSDLRFIMALWMTAMKKMYWRSSARSERTLRPSLTDVA